MDTQNKIIYDWLTFTTRIHSVEELRRFLGLSEVDFIKLERGMNGYPYCIHFVGISICYGGRHDMGVCVCMSGQGCRSFEEYGTGDFEGIFRLVNDNRADMNISRLDVAYDDFTGLLDIDTVVKYTSEQNYCARFSKWSVTFGSEGCCVGLGSMRSDCYIRIYDKKAERGRDDLDHWVRFELQLRNSCALGFSALDGSPGENFYGVVNNYVRFVEPTGADSNKRRWEPAKWWVNFLESAAVLSVAARPGTEYNIFKLDSFVFKQCSGAIATMIDIIGVGKFLTQLREARSCKSLNPRYKDLKNRMGTSDDSIIEYLRERGAL